MPNDPLKSWHPGAVKPQIVDFVARGTRVQGSDCVAEGERVVVSTTIAPRNPAAGHLANHRSLNKKCRTGRVSDD
jgi:hypothetical protein